MHFSEDFKDDEEPLFDDYLDESDAVQNLKESMQALRKRVVRNNNAQSSEKAATGL